MIKIIGLYINSQLDKDKKALEELRQIINSVANFQETIKYGMPAFGYHGKIAACFANHANHIGFYPYSGSILRDFSADLKKYKTSIGAIQLPKASPLPKKLITKIIKARMKEIDIIKS